MSDMHSKDSKPSKSSKASKASPASSDSSTSSDNPVSTIPTASPVPSTVNQNSQHEKTALVPSNFHLDSDSSKDEVQLSSDTDNIKLDIENINLYELGLLLGGFLSAMSSFTYNQYYTNDCCNVPFYHYGDCCNNMHSLFYDCSNYSSPSNMSDLGEMELR